MGDPQSSEEEEDFDEWDDLEEEDEQEMDEEEEEPLELSRTRTKAISQFSSPSLSFFLQIHFFFYHRGVTLPPPSPSHCSIIFLGESPATRAYQTA